MKFLAVLSFCLGVAAMLSVAAMGDPDDALDASRAKAVAVNYAVYRNAVVLYALKHPGHTGRIENASIALPKGWKALRNWDNRMQSGTCFVFGPASPAEVLEVRRLFRGSMAIIATPLKTSFSPAFVPAGSVVSIIEVLP